MSMHAEFPKINFRRNDVGDLYIAPRRKQYEIDFKRDDARELRLKAKYHQDIADEYKHMADRADALADAWEKEVEK